MGLRIETFDNRLGGACFFKAIGHPLVQVSARALHDSLAGDGPIALYDPHGMAAGFAEIHPLDGIEIEGVYVQAIERVGGRVLERTARPVTDLPASAAGTLLIVAFDAGRVAAHIRHLIPRGMRVVDLDVLRLPDEMLTNRSRYLDPLNFATNFAFFRDQSGHHTRIATANYWTGYSGQPTRLWARLFDSDGSPLADWWQDLSEPGQSIEIESAEVRERFGLGPFTGQLFLHFVGAAAHEVVKYALDTYGDDEAVLSCTHDANAWPADFYAGLPAPREGERVVLWLQNSHPRPMPAEEVGLNLMGSDDVVWLGREIGPFATLALDVADFFPEARWPGQLEFQAGRWFVRPRYEIEAAGGRSRIAHVNVERTDLRPDPRIGELANLMGKGFLLPAPVLPPKRYAASVLPTPMAREQADLPVALLVYDAEGREVARHAFGCLPRDAIPACELDTFVDGALGDGYGHMELVYDFAAGGGADGWLHAIFRYRDRETGHEAETSFGAHVFNTVLTYKGEPQSYSGQPPGLSTRLFLRLGPAPLDTMCHLIYPASTPWHAQSQTVLLLHDGSGREVARRDLPIPCGGSRLFRYRETFDEAERSAAGHGAYVVIRDRTCRLFGYHGLVRDGSAFSLDHMFGF